MTFEFPKDWWTTDLDDEPCDGCGITPSKSRGHGAFICEKCYEALWCPECRYKLDPDHVCVTLEEDAEFTAEWEFLKKALDL